MYSLVTFKVTSKQVTQDSLSLDYVPLLPIVVPELLRFSLLFGDLTPNFASKFEARSKPPDLLTWKYPHIFSGPYRPYHGFARPH